MPIGADHIGIEREIACGVGGSGASLQQNVAKGLYGSGTRIDITLIYGEAAGQRQQDQRTPRHQV